MKIIIYSVLFILSSTITAQNLNYIEHSPHSSPGELFAPIFTLGEDRNGAIYAAGNDSKIYKYQKEEWTSFSIPNSNNIVEEITGDKVGNIYVAVRNEGLWVYKDSSWILFSSENSVYPESTIHGGIAWDKNQQILWVGTNDGLIKYQNDSLVLYNHESEGSEFIDDYIIDLTMGNDGSIWMIAKLSTLIHYKNGIFTSIPVGFNLEKFDMVFTAIAINTDGDIALSTSNYGVLKFDKSNFEFVGDFDESALSMDVDNFKNIWVTDERAIWNIHDDTIIKYQDPIIPDLLYEIFVSSKNHVWLAGKNGAIIEIVQDFPDDLSFDHIENKNVIVYPNPLQRGKTININAPDKIESISIFNVSGEKVYSTCCFCSKKMEMNLNSGLYFIKIFVNNNYIFKKLVIN